MELKRWGGNVGCFRDGTELGRWGGGGGGGGRAPPPPPPPPPPPQFRSVSKATDIAPPPLQFHSVSKTTDISCLIDSAAHQTLKVTASVRALSVLPSQFLTI